MPYLKYEKKLIELTEQQTKDITYRIDKKQFIPIGIERLDFKKCEIYKQLPYNYSDFEIEELPKDNFLPNINDGQKWIQERNEALKLSAQGKAEREYSRFRLMYNIIFGVDVNQEIKKKYKKITEDWFSQNFKRTMADSKEVWFKKNWGNSNRLISIYADRALDGIIRTEIKDKQVSKY